MLYLYFSPDGSVVKTLTHTHLADIHRQASFSCIDHWVESLGVAQVLRCSLDVLHLLGAQGRFNKLLPATEEEVQLLLSYTHPHTHNYNSQ